MSSIIDFKSGFTDIWSYISNIFLYLKYFAMQNKFKLVIDDVNVSAIINSVFWFFLLFSFGFAGFYQLFHTFLQSSNIKFYKRKHFARSIWNIAFFSSSAIFLYYYHEYMISPQLIKNTGRLFPTYDNTIFYVSQQCDRFKVYAIVIVTFYLHAAMLDLKENDYCEAGSKILYSLAIISLNSYRFENYFVILNLNQGIFHIITECLFLLAMQGTNKSGVIYQILLGLRIASWSHVFISLLPFKYLIPTLFDKNFKFLLNIFIWLWYGLSIWNSPVLQYFYHQNYHNIPSDCAGEGSAAKCILLKDSIEHRHFKALRKAYLEVKLANERNNFRNSSGANDPSVTTKENNAAKAFQTMKCIMVLKRKLKRMREGREKDDVSGSGSGSESNE